MITPPIIYESGQTQLAQLVLGNTASEEALKTHRRIELNGQTGHDLLTAFDIFLNRRDVRHMLLEILVDLVEGALANFLVLHRQASALQVETTRFVQGVVTVHGELQGLRGKAFILGQWSIHPGLCRCLDETY